MAEQVLFAQQIGWTAAGLSAAMTAVAAWMVLRKGLSAAVVVAMAGVVVAHPVVWMSPTGPGCGRPMLMASIVFVLQSLAMFGWVAAARNEPR